MTIQLPLKAKYLVAKPSGNASRGGNSTPKKKSIAAMLERSARSGKHTRKA